jgi:hypothetical protein
MVLKKKKEEKTKKKVDKKIKKKVVKKQVIKKDVKKNTQEIDKLKKQLKALSVKYLAERKKRTTPKQYQKVKKDIESKVNQASSQTDLIKLISLLGGKGSQPATTSTQGGTTTGTIQDRLNRQTAQVKDKAERVADIYKDWVKTAGKFENIKDKFNNGTLTVDDLKELYKDVEKVAKNSREELPSWAQIKALYEGGRATLEGAKKIANYMKRFMNQYRPANQSPVNLSPDTTAEERSQTAPTPPPPPATTPTPPPPPAEGIRGNPIPQPPPNPIPLVVEGSLAPIQYLNSISGTIGAGGLLSLLGVGGMLGNRLINNRQGENDRLIRNRQEVGVQAGGGIAQAGMAEGARAVAEGVANVARDLQLDREALDSTQDIAERVEQNERDITDAGARARRWLERTEQYEPQRASQFRAREAQREVRQQVAEDDRLRRRRENLRGTGVSVEDIEGMQERMLREAEEEGIRGAEGLVRNFARNLEGQFDVGVRVGRALEEGGRDAGLAELRRDDMPEFDAEGNTIV